MTRRDFISGLKKCDELTRREFISQSARSILGVRLAPLLGATLGTRALAETVGVRPARARNIIYLYMGGGMSQIDTFDPKPGSNSQGPVETLRTDVPGVAVSEFLPGMSKLMGKVAVINSMYSTQGAHEQGNYYMHTSYTKRGTIGHPSLGSWAMRLGGRTNESIPGYVSINGGSNTIGHGFMESRYGPVIIGNPEAGLQHSALANGITEDRFHRRLSMAKDMNAQFLRKHNHKAVRAYNELYDEAVNLMRSEDLEAFDITREPDALRDAYGRNSFGQGCLLARRLAEYRVRFVEVNLGGWDTHTDNFDRVQELSSMLDRGMSTLLADLDRRGMLEETLVVLTTEFGRTPNITAGRNGRDHYPQAFSSVLAGGGVQGGAVYGRTNSSGHEIVSDRVTVPDFNATIAYALGLPLDKIVTSPSGRPFRIADKGQPVRELFG